MKKQTTPATPSGTVSEIEQLERRLERLRAYYAESKKKAHAQHGKGAGKVSL